MKLPTHFSSTIRDIVYRDGRYAFDAYPFVLASLDYALERKSKDEERRHITGQELLECIRDFAPSQFGPMTRTVLNHWGVRETRDFGEIVFNMVEAELMGKTEQDSIDDFVGVYSFDEAFGQETNPLEG